MSAQEERQRIIRENIPKLIQSLTNFEPSDPNFQLCEQCAWHTIRNHRNLSVNSHEVRRRIDGAIEKFIIGNHPQHAKHLKRMCDELIAHPLCVNHYELDVQWAIIEFLLNVSYNPVGSIRRSSNVEFVSFQSKEISVDSDVQYWVNLLKEDCIPLDQQQCDLVDSELSDWSECSSDNDAVSNQAKGGCELVELKPEDRFGTYIAKSGLIPPQKEPHYKLFDSSVSQQWLLDNVQHSWWQKHPSTTDIRRVDVDSNFCRLWSQCLISTSARYREITPISTTSEYCLLREIIWMFQEPVSCKFFNVKNGKISVKNDVSISSATEHGLKTFLQSLTPYMEKLSELQIFIKNICDYQGHTRAPYTYEYYSSGLKLFLKAFFKKLVKTECEIKAQKIGHVNTVMQFRHEFDKDIKYLELLHSFHSFSVLDYTKFPAHICSAHLLAGLMHKFSLATSPKAANSAIVLFLAAIKNFCEIIDTWWTEGRLDDWHDEFLLEKKSFENEEVELRLYEKCKEKSFFVPQTVSNVIQQDAFLGLLKEHSLQAGCTLSLLYQINKINELKNSSNFKDTLYSSFIEAFINEISKYKTENENVLLEEQQTETENLKAKNNEKVHNDTRSPTMSEQFWSFQDEFLMMSFKCSVSELPEEYDANKDEDDLLTSKATINILDILDELNKTSQVILPLENIIRNAFAAILKSRISFANSFVMNMYKNEFEISRHLQNMRRVMLLEASDMNVFYIHLFKDIESGKVWANPFLLTVQLDDILCSKISHISSLFCIDIISTYKCETNKVIDAVDQLSVSYNINKQFRGIITEKNLSEYNEVFRFLLKVKWGLWALENLQFQKKCKTRPPYAELKMIDLLMRRLEQLRFWILYAMQCIHFYLMTHVLQSMGMKLDEKIMNCTTLSEMRSVHESFIETVGNYCFLKPSTHNIKVGVEQLLNLIYVLRYEWATCLAEIEEDDSTDEIGGEQSNEEMLSSQIDAIESAYIRCHGYLGNVLNNEVYAKQNSHLAGLSAAFNSSMPY